MFEQTSSPDIQVDVTIFDNEWKWKIVLEEMEKKFETFYTVSNEWLKKAGPMIWTVFRPLTMLQNVKQKEDKGDKDTSTNH